MNSGARCLFCGGDRSEPNHGERCDGRQGGIEAELPPFISGLTADTWNTSAAAAHSIEDARETQRERVFDHIHRAGLLGRTDDELQAELGLDGSSERPRRRELQILNRIIELRDPEGRAVRRLTRTHRRAVVWIDRRLAEAVAS